MALLDGEIVARRHNERELTGDPTAHAELLCLRDAAAAKGHWRLHGVTLVVTLEPCPMCAGALWAARLDHLVYGAADLMPSGARANWLTLAARYLRRPRIDPINMVSANRSVMGFNLIWLWDEAERLPEAYAGVAGFITRPPFIGRRFPFADAPAVSAHVPAADRNTTWPPVMAAAAVYVTSAPGRNFGV